MKLYLISKQSVPVAARSIRGGRSSAKIVGSNPTGGMDVCCECRVLSVRGIGDEMILVQRSPTDCGASLCEI
jgi:hypothetical protein